MNEKLSLKFAEETRLILVSNSALKRRIEIQKLKQIHARKSSIQTKQKQTTTLLMKN